MKEQLLNKLSSDRIESRQVDELVGLARGLIADGSINEAEVMFLEGWLANNLSISGYPLIRTLYTRVQTILADGITDQEECADLLSALTAFTAGDAELGEASKSSTLPLCNPQPPLIFEGFLYCFTGTFSFGQRKACESAVVERGGLCGSLSKKTRVLVIGSYATESWKHSSFGNKIMKAVEYRDAGYPISIVSEQHWAQYL